MMEKTTLAMNERGFNVCPYWDNNDPDFLSFVPTSAHSGEGMCDLVTNLVKMGQFDNREKLMEKDIFECTVLEVKQIEGLGMTIDVTLVNGVLKQGDTIVVSGMNGPIVTKIRGLLTPFPMKEMRVKGDYQHHQKIKGAMGIKISAPDLDHALAGSALFRCTNERQIEEAKEMIEDDICDILDKYVDKTKEGVIVQASTLGSLEALLEFLKCSKIPVAAVGIGPVHKKDCMKGMKSVTGGDHMRHLEYATLLCFDVRVMPDAQKYADENGIKVFTAKIIYHLFDDFTEYKEKCEAERKIAEGTKAVFPCVLEMVKGAVFMAKSPIIIGCQVKEGVLKVGTPLCVPDKNIGLRIGTVESMEIQGKPLKEVRAKDGQFALKLAGDSQITYGRHFDDTNQIVSMITRDSLDALKAYFKADLEQSDLKLCVKLKKVFSII